MERSASLTLDFPSLTTRKASLFGSKSCIFFKYSVGGMLFLSSWRLLKDLVLMWASKPPLKVFLHSFASPQTWGFVSARALSLHERALLFWAFLIFMNWGKWCGSSGRNGESLNWKQLFCLWSPNARILEEMGIGGDANMYVWWRKCFEVMQLSVSTF